jgi:hypothetical protein
MKRRMLERVRARLLCGRRIALCGDSSRDVPPQPVTQLTHK